MDKHHHPNPNQSPVDETRRRLAKAGLAAPAVLGVLASRPVLGAAPHHCTPSGHISGFASPPPGGATPCSTLGHGPGHYASGTGTWPDGAVPNSYFMNNNTKPRLFKNAPAGLGKFHGVPALFADAYQRRRTSNNKTEDATVWDVLAGQPINSNNGLPLAGWVLEAKSGFDPDITLGAEAVAAVMNAIAFAPNFPVTPQQAVEMFNKVVVSGGLYQVTSTHDWNAAEVKAYWQTLHA